MRRIRTLLIDDNAVFLDIARWFLSTEPQIEVVGSAGSVREALGLLPQSRPDLVLLDIGIADFDGRRTVQQLKALRLPVAIVLMSVFDDSAGFSADEPHGADGWITKVNFATHVLAVIGALRERQRAVAAAAPAE